MRQKTNLKILNLLIALQVLSLVNSSHGTSHTVKHGYEYNEDNSEDKDINEHPSYHHNHKQNGHKHTHKSKTTNFESDSDNFPKNKATLDKENTLNSDSSTTSDGKDSSSSNSSDTGSESEKQKKSKKNNFDLMAATLFSERHFLRGNWVQESSQPMKQLNMSYTTGRVSIFIGKDLGRGSVMKFKIIDGLY